METSRFPAAAAGTAAGVPDADNAHRGHGQRALQPASTSVQEGSGDGGATTGGNGDFVHLFERAREALTVRLRLEPALAEALALPIVAPSGVPQIRTPGTAARLAMQVVVDERVRRIVVRVIDVHTGTPVREFSQAALAAVAAKVGQEITHTKR